MKRRFPLVAAKMAGAAALAIGTAAFAAGPQRPRAELECESSGAGPKLDCTVRLARADGAPLTDANVRFGATMPSMPMAHSIEPVQAEATARPGEYRGTLGLEMTGVWTLQIDVSGPVRDRLVQSLRVECEGDRRCAAPPATGGGRAHDPKHGH